MKIWIDDNRPAPDGYIWCKSTLNALHTIYKYRFNEITEIHLDHDAGMYAKEGGDFINVLTELERLTSSKNAFKSAFWKNKCQEMHFVLHSQNAVGVQTMRAIIERNHWKEIR